MSRGGSRGSRGGGPQALDLRSVRYAIGLLAGIWIAAIVFTVALTGEYSGPTRADVAVPDAGPAGPCLDHNPASAVELDVEAPPRKPSARKLVVELDTTCGAVELTLDGGAAPRSVASFEHLARAGALENSGVFPWTEGTVRAGDPENFDRRSRLDAGYRIAEPGAVASRYPRGTVAMLAEPGGRPGNSGSQFFIVTGEAEVPPGRHAVIGEVTAGMSTLAVIERELPDRPIVIFSARVRK